MKNISIVTVAVVVLGAAMPWAAAAQQAPVRAEQQPTGAGAGTGAAASTPATPTAATYVLGPEDQILIHAMDVPDISDKPQRLDPNGDLRLPMVGRIHATGMTLEQLETELVKRLKVYVQEPDVAVTVTEFHSQTVSVIGAVGSSGVHQVAGRRTLVEVLSLAGGVIPDAGPSVRITRRLEWGRIPLADATDDATGAFSVAEIDLKSLLEARNPEKNIVILPNDVISVPRAETVFVVGEVGRPGAVLLGGGHTVTVMEAVSSSGGVLRTANASKARILRRVAGDEKRAELFVDIKQIMRGKANDVTLSAGDILVVPDSSGKRFTTRAIEAAISTGTMIGTYGIVR
jgi:polysaccharide export outer membrane protein